MDTKIIKRIIIGVIVLVITEFLLPVGTVIFTGGETMNALGMCSVGDLRCVFLIASFIAVATIVLAAVISGIFYVISKVIFSIRWKKRITQNDNISDKPYITATIENRENKSLRFYCVLKSIQINGKIDAELKKRVTEHTPRISWSGGSDEDIGVKLIDSEGQGILNIVSVTIRGLTVETAKGERYIGKKDDTFKFNLVLYKEIGKNNFARIPFSIMFEGYFDIASESIQKELKSALSWDAAVEYKIRSIGEK